MLTPSAPSLLGLGGPRTEWACLAPARRGVTKKLSLLRYIERRTKRTTRTLGTYEFVTFQKMI